VSVQVAFFFNLDGDAGCDPQETAGLHWQGWRHWPTSSDTSFPKLVRIPTTLVRGKTRVEGENGDKCAWNFSLFTFSNTTQRKIQGEWSNKAYNTGTGRPNSSGQKGVAITATSRSPHDTGKLNHAHPHDGCGWFGVFLYTQRVAMRREVTGHVVSRTMPLSAQSSSPS
jgi:hypothetical protein